RIIVSELRLRALDVAKRKGMVKVLSLASGSAQAVFEALAHFPYPVEILLVDADKKAGPYASSLARKHGLDQSVRFKAGNLLKFDRAVIIGDFRPDIVEMAGLLDYLRDDKAIDVIRRIRALLEDGGTFITCHIHDNPERSFMCEIIDWGREGRKEPPMLYRTRQELAQLIVRGGFMSPSILTEAHHIHSVAIARA
ncbi:MAG TPA: class I SAM-dependent methyltransferase family protein, partial [Candidatus Paceibacterota bacterium]|nr:class I SAM-dependent methyltransferase family protein [Candidatus Paceibacterota bacterium]